ASAREAGGERIDDPVPGEATTTSVVNRKATLTPSIVSPAWLAAMRGLCDARHRVGRRSTCRTSIGAAVNSLVAPPVKRPAGTVVARSMWTCARGPMLALAIGPKPPAVGFTATTG